MGNKILNIGYVGFKIALYVTYLAIAFIFLQAINVFMGPLTALPSWLRLEEWVIILSVTDSSSSNSEKILLLFSLSRVLLVSVMISFILKRFLRVIKSVNGKEAFKLLNIENFRRIGFYFFLIFLLDIVKINHTLYDNTVTFSFDPMYILGAITAFILAEVSREGNKLSEDNKLTI
ncbi:MAG: hypothetical protein ACI9XJ_002760 [Marivirga sp.]|jgi:hypothetical protein